MHLTLDLTYNYSEPPGQQEIVINMYVEAKQQCKMVFFLYIELILVIF